MFFIGQTEVIQWLKDNNYRQEWFKTEEIKKGMKEKGFDNGVIVGVHKDLIKLWIFNIVEFKGKSLLDRDKLWKLKFPD